MVLRSLHIENFRNIESLDIDFGVEEKPRKWTYLLGENGTGKTNILRAIALLLKRDDFAFSQLFSSSNNWVANNQNTLQIEGSFYRGGKPTSVTMCRGENRYPFKTELTHGYFVVGYGASRRLANSVSIQSSNLFNMPEARQVATLFSSDATLNPLESWAMELDYTDTENGLKRLREHLANLLPDVEFLRIDKSTKHLVFRTPDGEIRLDQLSDGFQNMLSWIGDLLYCHSESVFAQIPLSDLYGLLLLDEMELHLHPKWQRALRAYLDEKLPNFQIIATTHSPITAQQAQEDELYYMERESPTSPPKLHKYRGNPSQLMIHQMLNNPAFGNPTIDSYAVEQKRKEYIQLNVKSNRTSRENAKLKALNQELGDLPTISMSGQDDDNSVMSLLRKIETAL